MHLTWSSGRGTDVTRLKGEGEAGGGGKDDTAKGIIIA